uniref:Protein MgtC n=1 Tax=Rhodopseudomonas palustris (strain BisA53) TaxID=316055 RepID=Q07NY8_RHOP5
MDRLLEFVMDRLLEIANDLGPHLAALSAAYVLALPIGWNREKAERSAGLRTFPLVAVATCGVVQATEGILNDHPEGTARIIEGLMTGMGFIGGGAILKTDNAVRGTATAASLWSTGATGAAVGLGAYDVAFVVSLFTFLTLWLLVPFKQEGAPEAGSMVQTGDGDEPPPRDLQK